MRGEGSGEVSDIIYTFTSMNEGGFSLDLFRGENLCTCCFCRVGGIMGQGANMNVDLGVFHPLKRLDTMFLGL